MITASALDPTIDRRNDSVYKNTLFSRDEQIFDTLASGISAGQHEGGGKSLEIRRPGFNLDHGGVNGGLKVLVDNVQQDRARQGHGQGYLGALKTVAPELVDDVDILNGHRMARPQLLTALPPDLRRPPGSPSIHPSARPDSTCKT